MCPANVSPLPQLDAADHLRPHCHTPPLALPLQFAHAQVPTATSPHATAGIAQHFAHAHAPALASSSQGWSRSCSLHRTGVAPKGPALCFLNYSCFRACSTAAVPQQLCSCSAAAPQLLRSCSEVIPCYLRSRSVLPPQSFRVASAARFDCALVHRRNTTVFDCFERLRHRRHRLRTHTVEGCGCASTTTATGHSRGRVSRREPRNGRVR